MVQRNNIFHNNMYRKCLIISHLITSCFLANTIVNVKARHLFYENAIAIKFNKDTSSSNNIE